MLGLSGALGAIDPVVTRIAQAALVPLGLGLALHALKLGTMARVWHRVLRASYPDLPVGARATTAIYVAGTGVNAVVPARAGLVVRAALGTRRFRGATPETIAATLLVESWVAAVPLACLVVGAAGLGLLPAPLTTLSVVPAPLRHLTGSAPLVLGLIALAMSVALAILLRARHRARSLARRVRQGGAILRHGRALTGAVTWAWAAFALRLAAIASFLVAFHLDATPRTVLAVVLAQALASLVPVTPGGAGTQQALMVLALGGIASSGAILAFAVGMQAAIAVLDVAVGAAALAVLGGRRRVRGRRRESLTARAPTAAAIGAPFAELAMSETGQSPGRG